MKIVKQSMLFALALTAFLVSKAQTADEIINKHFDAIGGKDKIDKIKSMYSESTVQVMGNDAPSTLTILNGKGLRMESDFNGQKMVQVFTDKAGWAINPMAGSPDPQAMPDDQYKAGKDQIDIGGPLYNYAAKGSKVELLGKEDSAYRLKVTNKDGVVTTIYIDPKTYLITKSIQTGSMMGQEMEITRTFSNFQKTDFGLLYPYTVDISYGGQFNITQNVKKIETNKDVDPKIFEMTK
ncbi:MAG: outer membrane lipoprotein-sorting protein [Bacteroidetes bacterium]|nr:MAG: outer membrane lipoprotein-sorting protein [Bacteroidota bacterium]